MTYNDYLKPFVLNGTDIAFILAQVTFRPLFDANHNALLNWDGTTSAYDGLGTLLYDAPIRTITQAGLSSLGLTGTSQVVDTATALNLFGPSYLTNVDLSGIRNPSGQNNNLSGLLWQYGAVDQIFPRMVAAFNTLPAAHDAAVKVYLAANPGKTAADFDTLSPAAQQPYFINYYKAAPTAQYAILADPTGTTLTDGTKQPIIIQNVVDSSPRAISLLTTTAGVVYDTWANHQADPAHAAHAPNEIYYDANGVATVLDWGMLKTVADGGLGQVDTQARFIGSAGAASTGSVTAGADANLGDHFIGGLNPGVSPSNGFFVLFGQFFDHGLDFIGKGSSGKTIKITLDSSDPLYGMIGPDGRPTTSITISRANVDSVTSTGPQYLDHTSPFIDQSQTYGSHQQVTDLLREWVLDPVTGKYHAGIRMLDGTTLAQAWTKPDGTTTHDTLPTLNELRAAVIATGRDALSWEDVLDLRNRDASGKLTGGTTGSALLLDNNPRFDAAHLHKGNAAEQAAVDAAIQFLGNKIANNPARPGDTFGMVNGVLTLHLGTALPTGPSSSIPAGTNLTGASALSFWVDFSNFSIKDFSHGAGGDFTATHDAVSEILMASVGDHYIAGDGRVNENFGLTSIHHVFHEEHNYQVDNFIDALHRDAIVTGSTDNLHGFQNAVAAVDGAALANGVHVVNGHYENALGDYVTANGTINWDTDKTFAAVKLIVEMEYQHSAVDQYARNVSPNIQEFVGYSPDKNPGVTLEYSQVAFRFGHSTLRETIDTIDPNGGLTGKIMGYALRDAFLNPDQYALSGPSAILLGMTHQQMNEVDEFVTPALNQGLLGQPLDLAAINIARGRDIGIPTLNDFREAIGLTRYTSWSNFGQNMQHPESLANFIAAYSFSNGTGNAQNNADALARAQAIVDLANGNYSEANSSATASGDALAKLATGDQNATLADGLTFAINFLDGGDQGFNQIDTWLGGLAEVHQPGGLLGETFDLVFVTQIESLMDGDRFYYLYRLAGQQFGQEVANGQLKDLVERNTGLTHLNGNIFGYADKYYDFGAHREVFIAANGGNTETQTTSNNHKYGDVVDQNGVLVTTDNTFGAHNGIGALTWNNNPANATAANNYANNGEGVGIYSNGGGTQALDGSIIKVDNYAYIRDTRTLDNGADTGANKLNDGVNLDGTPNSGSESSEVIAGTAFRDMLYAGGGDDTVYGEGGNDIISGGYGIDRLYGDAGSDTIYGGDNPDLIDGGAGDDFLYGESSGTDINGADQVVGGSGNDFISGGIGIDKLSAGSGDDKVYGDQDTDPFTHGDDGNDYVDGGSGGDILYGDNGDDVLSGGADQDQLFGGAGDDILRPGDTTGAMNIGSDEVLGGDGVDDSGNKPGTTGFDIIDFSDNTIRPGGVTFNLGNQTTPGAAVNGNLIQVPSTQIEGLIGSAGGDTLTGDNTNGAAGWLIGGNGDDTIQGGSGNDILIGGSVRLDTLIGKYGDASAYVHSAEYDLAHGSTESLDVLDARYAGATHRVAWNAALDGKGLIDEVNAKFGLTGASAYQDHFTELLRSDQFKDIVLGNSSSAGVASTASGNDLAVFTGNLADYTIVVTYYDLSTRMLVQNANANTVQVLKVTDSVAGRDGQDLVLGINTLKFADTTVTYANHAPVITSNGGGATAAVSIAENSTAVTTVSATDLDPGTSLSYSISGGADAARFQIDAATGALIFKAAPNFEAPTDVGANNVYDVVVQVSDGSLTDTQAIAVTVTNLNENPVITSGGGGATATASIAENSTAVATVTATDPDAGATLSYSISGGADAALFQINAATGALSFKAAPNYEAPADAGANNVYDVVVQVSDGSLTDTQAIAVSVTNVNEAPVLTGAKAVLAAGAEDTAYTVSAANLLKGYTDPEGDTLSISGLSANHGVISDNGNGTFTFTPDANYNGPVTLNFTVSDGKGGSVAGTQSFTLAAVNDAAVFAGNLAGTVAESSVLNGTSQVTGTLSVTDIDNSPAFAAQSVTSTYGSLSLAANGSWTYVLANNNAAVDGLSTGQTLTDTVTVTATDGTRQAITITINGVDDVRTGTSGADTITGTSGNDVISGLAGNDTLDGGAGNDVLDGGAGNDSLTGGAGTDTATYASATAGVTVSLATTSAQNTGGAGTDTLATIENLIGSGFNDVLTGSNAANTIDGGAGNDTIDGGAGNDTLIGGAGTDTLTYASANAGVTVNLSLTAAQNTGGSGTDTLSGFENVTGSGSGDTLSGDAGNNVLDGGAGNDVLDGGAGNDTLTGGAGTDTASYASATAGVTVSLALTAAQNTVGAGTDTLATIENLLGSGFNDTLTGSTAANTIDGGAGNDTINGGSGADVLTGGAGADTFLYSAVADSTPSALDRITDFVHGTDKIGLSAIDPNSSAAGDQAFQWGGNTATARGIWWSYDAANNLTHVYGDTNGNASTIEFQIDLAGQIALTQADFVL